MLTSVLVANRGEIAVRITRTLRSMGIRSVAVFSEADRDALHVAAADESVLIGPADARSSYLSIDRIIEAARHTGAEAIHPGYGFLSENVDFARACEDAGITFIGPTPASIALMGDKWAAREAAVRAGVPVLPGAVVTDADLAALVREVGLPLIVKPAAGGGGKGMRVVTDEATLPDALASARREAWAAFGDDALLVERLVVDARHVEVQVVGDGRGGVVHLGDRDCSLQRRHQKVIEEAPAPFLGDEQRERMRSEAVTLARSVSYRGVGTVEFIVAGPSTHYFLEMNTRLQVEHPVTEMVTGLDLVELQLRVAAGEGLPLRQEEVVIAGHAVEARVYAEDGHRGFLPSSGRILAYREPPSVRVDSGVRLGDVVGTHYDPLLLKVIARGDDRNGALDALDAALADTVLLGLAHNGSALRALLADRRVRDGSFTTALIDTLGLGATPPDPDPRLAAVAALELLALGESATRPGPWTARPGWRVGGAAPVEIRLLDDDGRTTAVRVWGGSAKGMVSVDGGERVPVTSIRAAMAQDGLHAVAEGDVVWVGGGGDSRSYRRQRLTMIRRPGQVADADGDVRSPMPGSVVLVAVSEGDAVRAGDLLLVVEAMKMEYPLVAPSHGRVSTVAVRPGEQVARGQLVAEVGAEEDA